MSSANIREKKCIMSRALFGQVIFSSQKKSEPTFDFHTKMSDFLSLECKEKFKPRRDINWGDHFQFNLTVEKVDITIGLFNTFYPLF